MGVLGGGPKKPNCGHPMSCCGETKSLKENESREAGVGSMPQPGLPQAAQAT